MATTKTPGTQPASPIGASAVQDKPPFQEVQEVQDAEEIFNSPPSNPEDDMWIELGKKIVFDSLPAIRSAANSLTSATGLLQAIYLGVLAFSGFIPKHAPLYQKLPFIIPPIIWLLALYNCINVALTKEQQIYLNSPDDIQAKTLDILSDKQDHLKIAYWLLTGGLIAALGLIYYRIIIAPF